MYPVASKVQNSDRTTPKRLFIFNHSCTNFPGQKLMCPCFCNDIHWGLSRTDTGLRADDKTYVTVSELLDGQVGVHPKGPITISQQASTYLHRSTDLSLSSFRGAWICPTYNHTMVRKIIKYFKTLDASLLRLHWTENRNLRWNCNVYSFSFFLDKLHR